MTRKIAKLLLALALCAAAATASAREINWRPAPHGQTSPTRLAQTQQFTPARSSVQACTMGGYIRWSCRGDQVCGHTAGSCR